MPPTIQELLDKNREITDQLIEEIRAYKDARTVNKRATDSLDSVVKLLNKTAEAIKPFTELRFKKLTVGLIVMAVLNTILLVGLIVVVLLIK